MFHFSEQAMATAVPAKTMTIGMTIREAIRGVELGLSVVIGGI